MIIKDSSKSVSIPRINIKEFNKFIEEIVGVDSVKEIAENAFEGCTNLKDIPSCNTSIEESAPSNANAGEI